MAESYAHLHVHSDYSLARGASKVSHLVARAAELGIPAMALVDEGNMFGGMEFSKTAAGAGVQPIVGTKLWMTIGDAGKRGSLVLLAQTEAGYRNICSILSAAHRPREGSPGGEGTIPVEAMEQDLEGIICLTGGRDGVLWRLLAADRGGDAADMLSWLRYSFGDRLYVELCRYGDEDEQEVAIERRLLDMAFAVPPIDDREGRRLETVPIVGTSEVWYASENRHDTYEIMAAVESKGSVVIRDNAVVGSPRRLHMRGAEEMRALFSDVPEAFENAANLARRCSFMIKGRDPILPPFSTEGGRSEAEELRVQAADGLVRRLDRLGIPEVDREKYRDRLAYELDIIERMKFPGYFLIVSDFIRWAKGQGIPVGPGRGSGAGSLVAYSLEITDLDPLRFGLLFERFLNPDRVSMPDFDIDFCQDRRDEVIQYVQRRYGTDYVSLIATFGEIKSKTAIRDVGRVMRSEEFGGYGYGELDTLSKLVSMDGQVPKTLAASYEDPSNPEFRARIDSDPKYQALLQQALRIEGLYRNQGSHAAGVVIGGQPLHTLAPMGWDSQKGMPVSQFNMKSSETAGLVKFDFLGLKTLSVLREAVDHIRDTTDERFDLSAIPLDDGPTYAMLADGEANGVFQFEGEGMKRVLRDIGPTRIEDLIAVAALYRPGPMEMIPHYAACKNGTEDPDYPEPVDRTRPFLEETFGIMVYQEQVMQVAQVVAGYSLGGADLLRRAMGKKIPAEMAAQRDLFVKGATDRGTSEETAGQLFDLIAKFAGYGFNKSHAAAYALIAYQTAFLKRHYPTQFLAALLTYEDKPEKMARIKEDMDHFGVDMLPPCVNASTARFRPERKADGTLHIRFGLTAIKEISGDLSGLAEARGSVPFNSLEDFHARAGTLFNKSQIQRLAEAGAFDAISSQGRYSAVNVLHFLAKGNGRKVAAGQSDLFAGAVDIQVPSKIREVPEWGNKADREFESVGFYFGTHPLDVYEPLFRRSRVKRKSSLKRYMQENHLAEMKEKRLAGLVEKVERRNSKKSGKPYVWASFIEKSDRFNVNFFSDPSTIEGIRTTLENARTARRPVIVKGDLALQEGRDDLTIWGRTVSDADALLSQERGSMEVWVSPEQVVLEPEEHRAVTEAGEAVRRGTKADEEARRIENDVRKAALARKVTTLSVILEGMRSDDASKAVKVAIVVRTADRVVRMPLKGTYVIGQSEENTLKSTDGVIAVLEAA